MVYATEAQPNCHFDFEYYQKHVYANGERIQLTTIADEDNDCIPTVYVHEDALGRAHYYSTVEAAKFAEMKYDVWGDPDYTNKVVRDGHNDYVYAVFTGHVYDVVLDIYFADARFYDASSRQWMAKDPAKDGLNWYQYCNDNPATFWDPTGLYSWNDFKSDFSNGWNDIKNGWNNFCDQAGEAWAKQGGYFTKFACDTGHWWDRNGETFAKGALFAAVGAGALITAIAVTPVAGMMAAYLTLSTGIGLTATTTMVGIGIGAVKISGLILTGMGTNDVISAFTEENKIRESAPVIYDTVEGVTFAISSIGTALFAPFVPYQNTGADSYGTLRKSKEPGQTHHLSQDAAFKSIIPTNDGLSIKLEGNVFTEPGSPHNTVHHILEDFWNQYRIGGALEGSVPTVAEYNQVVGQALLKIGYTMKEVAAILNQMVQQQQQYGLNLDSLVPRIPGPIHMP